MKTIFKLTLLFIFLTSLEAKIIEVKQLFNKETVKVKEESVYETKSFYGETSFTDDSIKDIVLRTDGYITSLNADKDMMHVKKGDKLFSLYSDKIQSIQKELDVTKELDKRLYKSSLEKLKSFDIKLSQLKGKDVYFYAPFNGVILNKKINEGSYVKSGTTLMQIVNMDKLWFISKVYQNDLSFLTKESKAKINLDGIDLSIKTKLDYIYPIVDNKTKTIDVRFEIDNKELNIYPNMFGKVVLKTNPRKMLTLPKTAVLTKGAKHYVFKPISEDEFEPVVVEARRLSSSKFEIEEGLSVGDEVINNALFLLDSDAITNNLYDDEDTDW